jgi:hypothetical protein
MLYQHSSGRGGLGNINRSRSRSREPTHVHSTGRGGLGNIKPGDAPPDIEEEQSLRHSHEDGPYVFCDFHSILIRIAYLMDAIVTPLVGEATPTSHPSTTIPSVSSTMLGSMSLQAAAGMATSMSPAIIQTISRCVGSSVPWMRNKLFCIPRNMTRGECNLALCIFLLCQTYLCQPYA